MPNLAALVSCTASLLPGQPVPPESRHARDTGLLTDIPPRSVPAEAEDPGEDAERRARGCRPPYQRTGGAVVVGREPGVTSVEVRSPVSDSFLGEQMLVVSEEKVTVTELRAQVVSGLSLKVTAEPGHPDVILATCHGTAALRSTKQEATLSVWLAFSDHTLAPLELYGWQEAVVTVASDPAGVGPASTKLQGLGSSSEEEEEEEDGYGHNRAGGEEEEEEEMVKAPERVTDLEIGMYVLLSVFCLAIFIFLINCIFFVLRYQHMEPPGSILVASEDDIRWVCEDMGLRDPEEIRSYMERIRGSS
ncbi:PREDICTED: transmembrane protein 132A [Tinamus guttatus]|uniref:transmembrane protein 132A n=1 Tax=Tinamus guttatus TaxID=94827 RepID=UPI00052EF65B|nr:PREDICTED: transmembrane protein 132A [Tinamus guttatus]